MNDSIFSEDYTERRAAVPKGIPLVVALSGISDPGGVVAQLDSFLWDRCDPEVILRFNTDLLLDYRARRPIITFEEDHFTGFMPLELTLSLCRDQLGSPFLLLNGFEPDFRWEQFADAVMMLVAEFEISVTIWSHAIPMPVPHTRPLRATVSGTREDLIEERSVWKPTTKLPASMAHFLEYRLHSLGEEVVGFAILVPHYLAGNEYPDALLFALESVMAASGLIFITDEVRTLSHEFRAQVDRQVSENQESVEMLRGLESRYDAYIEDQSAQTPLIADDASLPSAEQLASELERFLAQFREDNSNGDS